MSREVLKLTALLGEGDRDHDGRLLVDDLLDLLARHRVARSVLLRGSEGFGLRRRLQSGRLLTLSEDLPLMAVATDTPRRIHALLGEVDGLMAHGVLTIERARTLDGDEMGDLAQAHRPGVGAGVRLTCHVGRGARVDGIPAHRVLVDRMRAAGLDAAITLVGVDGTRDGSRVRARFFGANAQVPLVVSGVGGGAAAGAAAAALREAAGPVALTAERVTVCVRGGAPVAPLPAPDPSLSGGGREVWQKVTIHLADRGLHAGPAAYLALLCALREADAAGATVLRGVWGFQGSSPAHGDRPMAVPRRAPLVCVAVDRPDAVARWFEVVDRATRAHGGLAFAESVPALRARAGGRVEGTLVAQGPRVAPRRS